MLHHTADKSGLPHIGPMAGWEGAESREGLRTVGELGPGTRQC